MHRLLEAVPLPGGRWLEPCAGNGAIIEAVNELRSDIIWHANELREECGPDLKALTEQVELGDFFSAKISGSYDVIITNPPFRLAQQFVSKCMEHSDIVVMLLRVNFIGSAKRATFMREHAPDVHTLPNRPSFIGGGKTDSPEYGWFIFHGQELRSSGVLSVLDITPSSIRKAAHAVLEERRILRIPKLEGETQLLDPGIPPLIKETLQRVDNSLPP